MCRPRGRERECEGRAHEPADAEPPRVCVHPRNAVGEPLCDRERSAVAARFPRAREALVDLGGREHGGERLVAAPEEEPEATDARHPEQSAASGDVDGPRRGTAPQHMEQQERQHEEREDTWNVSSGSPPNAGTGTLGTSSSAKTMPLSNAPRTNTASAIEASDHQPKPRRSNERTTIGRFQNTRAARLKPASACDQKTHWPAAEPTRSVVTPVVAASNVIARSREFVSRLPMAPILNDRTPRVLADWLRTASPSRCATFPITDVEISVLLSP